LLGSILPFDIVSGVGTDGITPIIDTGVEVVGSQHVDQHVDDSQLTVTGSQKDFELCTGPDSELDEGEDSELDEGELFTPEGEDRACYERDLVETRKFETRKYYDRSKSARKGKVFKSPKKATKVPSSCVPKSAGKKVVRHHGRLVGHHSYDGYTPAEIEAAFERYQAWRLYERRREAAAQRYGIPTVPEHRHANIPNFYLRDNKGKVIINPMFYCFLKRD